MEAEEQGLLNALLLKERKDDSELDDGIAICHPDHCRPELAHEKLVQCQQSAEKVSSHRNHGVANVRDIKIIYSKKILRCMHRASHHETPFCNSSYTAISM